jgi:hypothetical protein
MTVYQPEVGVREEPSDDTGIVVAGADHVAAGGEGFCAAALFACIDPAGVTGWLAIIFGIMDEGPELFGQPVTGGSLLGLMVLGLMSWLVGAVLIRRRRRPTFHWADAAHPAG